MDRLDEALKEFKATQNQLGHVVRGAYAGNDPDTCCATSGRESTLREQAEQQVGYHRTQADKCDRAAAFFRENPAFDEFVRLVRSGAIQF